MTQLQILRNGQTQATLDRPVDPDSYQDMQDTLRDWLASERWDRGLWPQFTITGLGATRLQVVHP